MSINFLPGNFLGETLTEGGKTWTWDGQKWNLSGSSVNGNFVLRTGDVMTGNLVMDGADIEIDNGKIEFEAKGDLAYVQDTNNRFAKIVSRAPKDITDNDKAEYDAGGFGIKVELREGNTHKNKFIVGNQHGDIVTVSGGKGAQVSFATGFSPDPDNHGLSEGVTILGIPTPDFVKSPDDIAVNKEYVDARDDLLRQDILELEEEINAIAPSVEYGTWEWQNASSWDSPPAPGTFFLLDTSTNPPTITDKYVQATRLVIHDDEYVAAGDLDPVDTHFWTDATPGKLIQLYDAADPDFLLGRITANNDGGDFVYLDVELIQTSGQPNDNPDLESNKYLTRLNIFEEPSGGNASEFVKKIGDTMSGNLTIDRSTGTANTAAALVLKGERPDTTNSAATIKFENANSSTVGYLTYKSFGGNTWFTFDQDVDLHSHGLHSVARLRINHDGYIGVGSKERIKLRDPANNNDGNASVSIERPPNGRRGFAIRGTDKADKELDILWSYTNSSDIDAINYDGKMTGDSNLVNKKYVDNRGFKMKTGTSTNPTLERGEMFLNTNTYTIYVGK